MTPAHDCQFPLGLGSLAALCAVLAGVVFAAPPPGPVLPAEPEVQPWIGRHYPEDADHNRLADGLDRRILSAQLQFPPSLDEAVAVELVFSAQVTPQQIDSFRALGGQIDYVYRSVSYGWNGRLPLGQVAMLPSVLGETLVLVTEPQRIVPTLDLATQSGRVRSVWASGFAGNTGGFDGDPNITIAILDTGIDNTHPDLAGRQRFWKDYTADAYASPRDLAQHGTHVASIALGSGVAGGTSGTLFYSQAGSLTGLPNGVPVYTWITLPETPLTINSTARWAGSTNTSFGFSWQSLGTFPNRNPTWQPPSPLWFRSPLDWTSTFTPSAANRYSPTLVCNGLMSDYVITTSITNYPASADGFNRFRGVAPACSWAGAKVFTDTEETTTTIVAMAIDDLVSRRVADNIKIINLSLALITDLGTDSVLRQQVNTAVNNGIVVCAAAGNNAFLGQPDGYIDDPGRAALALTVGAADDVNHLSDYTSLGFSGPNAELGEDFKLDLIAPGGSYFYSGILAADSDTGDTASFPDQRPDDYYSQQGTSMASPFAAGCAALVIDAMQQRGVTWDFTSAEHAKYVKMVLCATATETNAGREDGTFNPTLERQAIGPLSFPIGKDPYEGYGLINADAAVEAAYLTYVPGAVATVTLGSKFNDRRAWARTVSLTAGATFAAQLAVPAAGDFDLYLYSGVPSVTGTPVLLAASATVGNGIAENISYSPAESGSAIVVVKRVSGEGAFAFATLSSFGDYDQNGHVDGDDLLHFLACQSGPRVPLSAAGCADADFDHDGDVDQADFSIWQRCYTGPAAPIDPHCAD